MRIELASPDAVKHACKHFHYSKCIPAVSIGLSVFEGEDWCGVITYGYGANNHIACPFNLTHGEVIELTRVALNGKQSCTSKAVALSIDFIKKNCKSVKILISFADSGQNHIGTIYQATNWFFIGYSKDNTSVLDKYTNTQIHKRTAIQRYGTIKGLTTVKGKDKYKYAYPLTKQTRKHLESIKLPYPKKPQPIESTENPIIIVTLPHAD